MIKLKLNWLKSRMDNKIKLINSLIHFLSKIKFKIKEFTLLYLKVNRNLIRWMLNSMEAHTMELLVYLRTLNKNRLNRNNFLKKNRKLILNQSLLKPQFLSIILKTDKLLNWHQCKEKLSLIPDTILNHWLINRNNFYLTTIIWSNKKMKMKDNLD